MNTFIFVIFSLITLYGVRAQSCSRYHTVVSGDICWDIAGKYGISLDSLQTLNPGLNCGALQIGQRICVAGGSSGGSNGGSGSCASQHTVTSGQYCYLIASNYGLTLDSFIALNPGINCNNLQIGQTVCVQAGNSGGGGGNGGTTVAPSGDALITKAQFITAVTSNGYVTPTDTKYLNLVNQAASKGSITTKRELAMFLAQILWESGGLIYLSELACALNNCAGSYQSADDVPGKYYYGRGYIQLTWSYNYKAASLDLYRDLRLLNNPEQVATNDEIAWAVSFWYWQKHVHNRPGVSAGQFGVTTNAINGALECAGPYKDKAKRRFEIYKNVLKAFSINETPIETGCYN